MYVGLFHTTCGVRCTRCCCRNATAASQMAQPIWPRTARMSSRSSAVCWPHADAMSGQNPFEYERRSSVGPGVGRRRSADGARARRRGARSSRSLVRARARAAALLDATCRTRSHSQVRQWWWCLRAPAARSQQRAARQNSVLAHGRGRQWVRDVCVLIAAAAVAAA